MKTVAIVIFTSIVGGALAAGIHTLIERLIALLFQIR